MQVEDPTRVERVVVSNEPRHQRFIVTTRSYVHQFSHIYTKRILQMRGLVLAAAHEKWGRSGKFCV